ncbi:MAG: pyridoxamine 5'-phosphate oxidase family protein [Caldimonas sp.]
MHIDTLERLRALYPAPKERAVSKQLAALDRHCRHFIGLSPFVVVASAGAGGSVDASPRGGPPGFVKSLDERTLLIPDAPGNNRLDSLENIVATGAVGLFFIIPGIDETLRVNGTARLSSFDDHLQVFSGEARMPRLVIEVTVAEAYLHCAKAFLRSKLWQPSAQQSRAALPTMGEMISDQTGIAVPAETHEQMLARYAPDL